MEVVNRYKQYNELLQKLLNLPNNIILTDNEELKINIYITLLSLSNKNYEEEIYQKKHKTVEQFLRKTNNLKVKIQLKRNQEEIDKLTDEIINLYENNKDIISKYNKENIDIINTINTKDPKEITKLIDKLTKIKLLKDYSKEDDDKLREAISSNILENSYYIEDDSICIVKNDPEEIKISINKFYEIFEYLLDIDIYKQIFPNNKQNRERTILIANIIKLLVTKEENNKLIIPIALTHILNQENIDYSEIDMSNFNIENIKINELYSLASMQLKTDNNNNAKWKNVIIPNEYLFNKINEMVKKGMYYFLEDKFILENIDNNISDFKISIEVDKTIKYINDIINNLNNEKMQKRAA